MDRVVDFDVVCRVFSVNDVRMYVNCFYGDLPYFFLLRVTDVYNIFLERFGFPTSLISSERREIQKYTVYYYVK